MHIYAHFLSFFAWPWHTQEELVSIMPHVNEANAISEELDAKRSFEIVLVCFRVDKRSSIMRCMSMHGKVHFHKTRLLLLLLLL